MTRAAALLLALSACGEDAPRSTAPKPPPTVFVVAKSDDVPAGTIRGYVHFLGEAPVLPPILLGAADGCGSLRESAPAERLALREARVANVLVRVKSGPALAEDAPVPLTPVVLDQKGCVFEPHVVTLRAGQPLALHNSDPLVHNVNVRPSRGRNDSSNRSLAPGSRDLQLVFPGAELSIPIRCDIHPWMQAWVHVLDTPHYALTGPDGAFELSGLPAGEYQFEVVHEWLGRHTFLAGLSSEQGLRAELGIGLPAAK